MKPTINESGNNTRVQLKTKNFQKLPIVFVDLAEEKWYEEKIPDAELYSWGVKINENCPDEAIRYKAAHWFVQAAQEMERKERVTGKVSMSSYKGFFEKLADDLVGKK